MSLLYERISFRESVHEEDHWLVENTPWTEEYFPSMSTTKFEAKIRWLPCLKFDMNLSSIRHPQFVLSSDSRQPSQGRRISYGTTIEFATDRLSNFLRQGRWISYGKAVVFPMARPSDFLQKGHHISYGKSIVFPMVRPWYFLRQCCQMRAPRCWKCDDNIPSKPQQLRRIDIKYDNIY